jgi:DNA polymerase elongation subunit (family B)
MTLAGCLRRLSILVLAACGCGYPEPPSNPEIKPAPITRGGWTVKRRYTVNRVLVAEVECPDVERAAEIAKSLVEPVTEAYDEVLVYVRPPDRSYTRRVQWTRKTGYQLLDY